MEKSLGVTEVRNNFAEIVDEIRYLGSTVILIKSGKPAAAIIPITQYEKLLQLLETESKALKAKSTEHKTPNGD